MGDEEIVQARGRTEPDLIGGIEHGRIVGQKPLGVIEGHGLGEAFRRQPTPTPEQVRHLPFGHAEGMGEGAHVEGIGRCVRDMGDGRLHGGIVGLGTGRCECVHDGKASRRPQCWRPDFYARMRPRAWPKAGGETRLVVRIEKGTDLEHLFAVPQRHARHLVGRVAGDVKPDPEGIEIVMALAPLMRDVADLEMMAPQRHLLESAAARMRDRQRNPQAQRRGDEDENQRPDPGGHQIGGGHRRQRGKDQNDNADALWPDGPVRRQQGVKNRFVTVHLTCHRGFDRISHPKANRTMKAMPARRTHSKLKPAEIDALFAAFASANPEPKGELEYLNAFTLLVAVVLSAQATDAGVNKATRGLFAVADTPESMVALGLEGITDYIKSIGLFRNKAKNVLALSEKLIAEFGSEVPKDREALESLPGVGRKTANVVLNIAFGLPTIAVDTHLFRLGNRTGLAPGKTPREVEDALLAAVPERYLTHAHHWLILHGRYVCKARKPDCAACIIRTWCRFDQKTA